MNRFRVGIVAFLALVAGGFYLSRAQAPVAPMYAMYATTVGQLPPPGSGWNGSVVFVTDATTATDCTVGGATAAAFLVACRSTGAAWASTSVGH